MSEKAHNPRRPWAGLRFALAGAALALALALALMVSQPSLERLLGGDDAAAPQLVP